MILKASERGGGEQLALHLFACHGLSMPESFGEYGGKKKKVKIDKLCQNMAFYKNGG